MSPSFIHSSSPDFSLRMFTASYLNPGKSWIFLSLKPFMIPVHFFAYSAFCCQTFSCLAYLQFTFLSCLKMRFINILPMFLPSLLPLSIASVFDPLSPLPAQIGSKGLSLKCSIFYFCTFLYLSLFHFIILCGFFPFVAFLQEPR